MLESEERKLERTHWGKKKSPLKGFGVLEMFSDLKPPAARQGWLAPKQHNYISVTSMHLFESTTSSERDLVWYKKRLIGLWL